MSSAINYLDSGPFLSDPSIFCFYFLKLFNSICLQVNAILEDIERIHKYLLISQQRLILVVLNFSGIKGPAMIT